jgi:hypothetical protein
MQTFFALLGVVLGVALLWLGLKRLEVGGYWKTVISALDILVLVASAILLGWVGVILFLIANVVGLLLTSVRLAMQKEERLVYASTQCGATKEEIEDFYDELGRDPDKPSPFAIMGPIPRADLISRLAQRRRSIDEMRHMARPIALLWVVHRPDLNWLVDRFDQILRLYDMDASRSLEAANVISASTKEAAATFEEMVDAMVAAAGGAEAPNAL